MPAQVDQSPERVEEFMESGWFLRQAGIQLLPYLARTGVRIDGAISNRGEIIRHELDGSVCPRPNLLRRRIEQMSERRIFRVVNHVSNRRLALVLFPTVIWTGASES